MTDITLFANAIYMYIMIYMDDEAMIEMLFYMIVYIRIKLLELLNE